MTKHIVVGTAGHIDHGKTALVRALTGIDTDRLDEEKRRGITIDLGFAYLPISNGVQISFVDVPGHEKFIRNMLAGIGGIDLMMLVVASDESIMPQTREHFDICRLLEVRRGLVALTKTDVVNSELVELVKLETEDYLTGSFLEGAPVCPVSSRTGHGIDTLRKTLIDLAVDTEPKNSRHHFRLPIDRVFVMKGFGTVATGTLVSGSLSVDSEVEVLPGSDHVRVRGIEVHGGEVSKVFAGQRTAINLSNIAANRLRRGMVLTAAGKFSSTRRIDCSLNLLNSSKPLKYGARVHFHSGTTELEARVYFLDRRKILKSGGRTYTQLRFQDPLPVWRGDRFIIRQFSPVVTIGGGRIIDAQAPKHRIDEKWEPRMKVLDSGNPAKVLEVLVQDNRYGIRAADITARTAWLDEELEMATQTLVADGKIICVSHQPAYFVHCDAFCSVISETVQFLTDFHAKNRLLPGITKETLRTLQFAEASSFFFDAVLLQLVKDSTVAVTGEVVRLAKHQVVLEEEETEERERITSIFRQAGLATPTLSELLGQSNLDFSRAQSIVEGLLREGLLIKVTTEVVLHKEALDDLLKKLRQKKLESESLTVPAFKNLAGVSRKYAIPLLEYLDRLKITRRVGNERIIL